MAKKKRSSMYKLVNTFTQDMGSAGSQVSLGYIDKLDAQGISGYLNNVRVSSIINNYDGGNPAPGIMFYLTTGSTWNDDRVISARAVPMGGTVSLPAKRRITEDSVIVSGNTGRVYLWAELTDITVSDNIEARFVVETWGRFVEFTET